MVYGNPVNISRRQVLATTGIVTTAGLAGCTGALDDGSTDRTGPDDPDDSAGRDDPPDSDDHDHEHFTPIDRSIEGLSPAQPTEAVRLEDGDRYALEAEPVRHDPGIGNEIAMYAYNRQIPGPTLRVPQGAEITVDVTNHLPYETTVHWHGLRLDNAFDGVPEVTQDPIEPGETFEYTVRFPDEGVYWYHPHVREDIQQHLGLRGTIIVEGEPRDESWPREEVLELSDAKIVDGDVYPFWEETANHALMGRFGNHLFANAASSWTSRADPGERVRLHVLNAANVRPFKVHAAGADSFELVGMDGGFLPEPTAVSEVVLSPSERATIDVVMPAEGDVRLVHATPHGETELGVLESTGGTVVDTLEAPMGPHERAVEDLADAAAMEGEPIDVTWELDVDGVPEMDHGDMGHGDMDQDDESDGMSHGDMDQDDESDGMAHENDSDGEMGHGHDEGHENAPPPIEWEDGMEAMNEETTADEITHIIRNRETGAENMEIDHVFERGSYVRFKIVNLHDSNHPMQHPVHLHGIQFLVESIDGEANPHPCWKDTVHVDAGSEAVITVPMSNPGTWMFHCHISEHMEAGMMGTFTVEES